MMAWLIALPAAGVLPVCGAGAHALADSNTPAITDVQERQPSRRAITGAPG